eukprot:711397-Rhodomonas_salina.2
MVLLLCAGAACETVVATQRIFSQSTTRDSSASWAGSGKNCVQLCAHGSMPAFYEREGGGSRLPPGSLPSNRDS